MLRWKTVSVPFVGGLQEATEPLLQMEGFQRLHWFAPEKDGSLTMSKPMHSAGYSVVNALPDCAPTEGATGDTKVVRLGDGYGYIRNGYLYSESAGVLYRRGRVSPWVVEQSCVASATPNTFDIDGMIRHDSCISGSYLFTVYEYSGLDRLYVVVTDVLTGLTVKVHQVQNNASYFHWYPRIVPHVVGSSNAQLYFLQSTGTVITIQRAIIDATSAAASADMTGDISATSGKDTSFKHYDVWGVGTGQSLLAYVQSTGSITVKTLNSAGSPTSTESITKTREYVGAIAVSTSSTASRIIVAWVEYDSGSPGNHEIRMARRGSGTDIASTVVVTLASVSALATGFQSLDSFVCNRLGLCGAGSEVEYLAYNVPNNGLHGANEGGETDGDARPYTGGTFITTSGTIATSGQTTLGYRVQLGSRPFWDGTRACYLASSASGSSVLYGGSGLDATKENRNKFFVVMAHEYGQTGAGAFPLAHFGGEYAEPSRTVENPSENFFPVAATMRSSPCIESDGSVSLFGLERDIGQNHFRIMRYRLVKDDRVGQFAQMGGATYFCGGILTQWDGSIVREAGFIAEPCIQRWSTPASSSSMAAGVYGLAVTYSRVSAAGELIRSRPSVIQNITVTAGDTISVSVSPPVPSLIRSGSSATKTKTGQVQIEFWLTDPDAEAGPFYLVYSEPHDCDSHASVAVTLDFPFPSLSERTLPYSGQEVEELANDPPISPVALTEWRNRLWISDGYRIAYTKPYDRFRQAEFSLLQTVPKAVGPNIQALVPLGQGLATISDETGGIAMLYGEGPDITGAGSSLQGPTVMQQSLGTIAPGAIGRFGSAAFVMTPNGLRLLSEGGDVQRVGDPIEDSVVASSVRGIYVDGDDSVTVLHGSAAQRFHLPQKVWSSMTIAASHWAGDRLGGLQNNPIANLLETTIAGGFTDSPQVVTPWYRPAGELGELRLRRVWLLGRTVDNEYNNAATGLTVEIAYDYSDTYVSACTIPCNQMRIGTWSFRFTPARQRCRAFRLRFTVPAAPPLALTPDLRLVALRLQIGVRAVAGMLPGGNEAKGMVGS